MKSNRTSNGITRGALRRVVAAAVLAAFLPLATVGCFGKFRLVRKVYQYNQEVSSDKWIQWFAFLVLSIVPVYGIAAWIDALFANSVEFWTGENPITADARTRTLHGANGEMARATFLAPGVIDLEVVGADGAKHAYRLVREAGSVAAYDLDGRLIARVGDVRGMPALLEDGRG